MPACSVTLDSLRPYGLEPISLLCPWNFPGKETRAGYHLLFKGIFQTLVRDMRELASFFCSPLYEDTAIRQPSIKQEEGSHQNLTMLAAQSQTTYSLELWEIHFWYKAPSLWYFVIAAWTKTGSHQRRGYTCFSSVQFSRSVFSDSLQPRESQHARPPCPSPKPGIYSN